LQMGDRFVLDGRCLEVKKRDATALLVDEVFGRPQVPRWLGSGVPMSGDLARRIFLFRMQAAETLRDGEDALRAWLGGEFQLNAAAVTALESYLEEQEAFSEVPTMAALTIECVAMQACTECFVHTPLPRSANETIARVLLHRWKRPHAIDAMALAADLGFYLLVHARGTGTSADAWRASLRPAGFADDFQEHLRASDLLAQHFGRIAQTGLMILRHPAGRKRKVGGSDWAERRLYEQIRERAPHFVLLRQAEREALDSTCDLAAALAFVEALASLPIRVRHLPRPSPFGESLLRVGFSSTTITGERAPVREAV